LTEFIKSSVARGRIYRKGGQKERDGSFFEFQGSNNFTNAFHEGPSTEETEGHVTTEFGCGQQIEEAGPTQYGGGIGTSATQSATQWDFLRNVDPGLSTHERECSGDEIVNGIQLTHPRATAAKGNASTIGELERVNEVE
jgi:hypothetical protein